MNKIAAYFINLFKRHKKKSVFAIVIWLLFLSVKKGILQKIVLKMIFFAQKRMIKTTEKYIQNEQVKIQLLNEANEIIEIFLEKNLSKSVFQFSTLSSRFYENELSMKSLQRSNILKEEKNKIWKQISENVMFKIIMLLTIKPIFDFIYFYETLVVKTMEESFKKQYPDNSEKMEEMLKEDLMAIEEFNKQICEMIFVHFAKVLSKNEQSDETFFSWKYTLENKILINQFFEKIQEVHNLVFANDAEKHNFPETIEFLYELDLTETRKIFLSKKKSNPFDKIGNFFRGMKTETSFLSQFAGQLSNYYAYQPIPQESSTVKYINSVFDLLGSDFAAKFFELSSDYYLKKLYNRILLFYKKDFSEEELFESESTIYLAKVIANSDKILKEEFYSEKAFEMDKEMLTQKLKLSFYLKKNYSEIAKKEMATNEMTDQVNEDPTYELNEKEMALNQSFIGRINMDSLKTLRTTELFLSEFAALEMTGLCLKELARQMKKNTNHFAFVVERSDK